MSGSIRKVGLRAVSTSQAAVQRQLDGLIFKSVFYDEVIDRVTGNAWTTTLPSLNGKYVARFKKWYLAGPNHPLYTGTGVLVPGERHNKTECRQVNPIDATNINVPDGTLEIVDDAEALANGLDGWDFSTFGARVFKWTTTAAFQTVIILGMAGNTEKHGIGLIARAVGGAAQIKVASTNDSRVIFSNESYAKLESALFTSAADDQLIIQPREAGVTIYFIMPEFSEGGLDDSPVGNADVGPVTRATDAAAADGNGYQFDYDNFADRGACLGRLVVDSNGNVRTPTGDELVGLLGFSQNAPDITTNVNEITFTNATKYKSVVSSGVFVPGKRYILQGYAIGLSAPVRVKNLDDGDNFLTPLDGPFVGAVQATTDGSLRVACPTDGISGFIKITSVKEVQAEGTIVLEYIPRYDSDVFTKGEDLVTFGDDFADDSPLYQNQYNAYNSRNGGNYPYRTAAFSAGDRQRVACRWGKDGFGLAANGTLGANKTFSGAWKTGDTMTLSRNCELGREFVLLEIRNRRFSDAEMVEVTNV